jgi:predicted phage-related endonuclease
MQVQWYMMITGIHKAYIACLCGGNTYIQNEIYYDRVLCQELYHKAKYFWNENVLKNIRPEISGDKATTEYIKNIFNDIEENVINLDYRYDELTDSLKELKAKEKDIKKEISKIENKIKYEIGNNKGAVTKNYKISYGQSIKMVPDVERMKQDYIFDEYSKESKYRTLRISKLKK